jgi:hypothetical protein
MKQIDDELDEEQQQQEEAVVPIIVVPYGGPVMSAFPQPTSNSVSSTSS